VAVPAWHQPGGGRLLLFEEEQHNCSDKRSGFRYGAVRFYRDTS
jgi:hypothetical protein